MKKRFAPAALLLVFALLLPACQKGEMPGAAAENLFRAIKRDDQAGMEKYLGRIEAESSDPEITAEMQPLIEEAEALILEKLSYEVNDSFVEKNTATVDVKITRLDMQEIFKSCVQQAVAMALENEQAAADKKLTDEQLDVKITALLPELMKKDDAPMSTDVMVLEMKRRGRSWRVTNDQELRDAVTAGLDSLVDQMEKENSSGEPKM